MGFTGKLMLHSADPDLEPAPVAQRLIGALSPAEVTMVAGKKCPPGFVISSVLRWEKPDRSWAIWKRDPTSREDLEARLSVDHVEGPIAVADVPALMPPDGYMFIRLGLSELARPLCEAARRLPREVMGDFVLGSRASITLGWHDIIDGYDDPFLVDRAHLSVSLEGPLSPRDWEAARQMILDLPQLAAFRAPLEEIAGPMKAWVKWS